MDDYTTEILDKLKRKEESSNFILKYEIVDKNKLNKNKDKIIVYLANGKKVVFNYTNEIEQNILDTMKKQVINYKKIIEVNEKKKIEKDALIYSFLVSSLVMILTGLISYKITNNIVHFINMLIPSITLACSGLIYKQKYVNKYNDFKKNMLFIENEEKINQKVLENSNVLTNVISKKNYDKMVIKPDGKKGYTINSIDKMKLKELKNMLELIKLEDELNKRNIKEKDNMLVKKL